MENVPKLRVRLKFSRLGNARKLTHREQIQEFRKMVTYSGLPYFQTKAGNLKIPRMSFGPAISVGYESLCEYADLYLADFVQETVLLEQLSKQETNDFKIIQAKRIPVFFPSIESIVNVAEYEMNASLPSNFHQSINALPNQILYEKVKPSGTKEIIDVKPLILSIKIENQSTVSMFLKFAPKSNVKPEVALNLIAGEPIQINRILRKELYWLNSSGKFEILM
jgi:radical SAM-linked protein